MYETQAEIDVFFECLFQFKYIKKLGEGAFGIAILVDDEVEHRKKVFKLPKNKETTEALLKEGEYLRKLSEDLLDPHIIRLHQYGKVVMEWNGQREERYYLNMAFGGSSLRSKLGNLRIEFDHNSNPKYHGGGRRLPVEDALRISIEVCQGLEALHGYRGAPYRMLHRDIKPENLLIDDETSVARITDFGISRVIDRTSALVSFAGTLIYMDPECFKGRASVQSDLYSLGVVMYEMLTGKLPFQDFEQRLEGPPRAPHTIVPEIPEELSSCVLRTMENDLDARYENTSDLLSALRRLQAKLNPLEERYSKLSNMDDGRILCEDSETQERIAVRLVSTTASLTDFAQQLATLENLSLSSVDIARRHFRNEHIVGIVCTVPRGKTLAEKYARGARTIAELDELCQIIASVCDTLTVVHAAGVYHSFLSPFAITVTPNGPYVVELGNSPIFRARRIAGHSEDSVVGLKPQLPYISPQLLGAAQDPSAKDDIYSLGAILYALITGRPPIDDENALLPPRRTTDIDSGDQPLRGEAVAESPLNPRKSNDLVSPQVAAIIVKALRWNPHDRYDSIAEMSEALRACRWPSDTVNALIEDALRTYPAGGTDDELLEACRLIDRALDIDFGNVDAHYARGVVYFRNNSFKYAVEELEQVTAIAPTADSYDLLGQAYMKWREQYEKAIAVYSKALEFGENADLLDHLARAERKAGLHERAMRTMNRSITSEQDESIRERRKALLAEWKGASDMESNRTPTVDDDAKPQDSPKSDTLTQLPGIET